ncbi:MAG: acetylxylan esterase [Herbinix sp.]|jgi:hypothetical protein|nr:acetylxylan esterase [Herbinix sp.]
MQKFLKPKILIPIVLCVVVVVIGIVFVLNRDKATPADNSGTVDTDLDEDNQSEGDVSEEEDAANNINEDTEENLDMQDDSGCIVIDTFDNQSSWTVGGTGGLDTLDKKQGGASLATSGKDFLNFMHSDLAYDIAMPEDWQNWYLEGWIYLENAAAITAGSCVELSEEVDKIEIAYELANMGLKEGWNKIKWKLGDGIATSGENFKTLKFIRIFLIDLKENMTIKVDDLCMVREDQLIASSTGVLDKQIEAAIELGEDKLKEYPAENVAVFQDALAMASAVKSAFDGASEKPTVRDMKAAALYLETAIANLSNDSGITEKNLLLHGRTYYVGDALYISWSNSGFTVNFKGTGLTADMTASNTNLNTMGYVNIYVDGVLIPNQTICLTKPQGTYVLAENLPQGEHTLTLRKRNEAAYGGSATIGVTGLSVTNGVFIAPPKASEKQIEVIGDSITSGFGNMITDGTGDYTSDTVEGTMTYAAFMGASFGAEMNIISRSGIGFIRNASCDSFVGIYEQTAGLTGGTGAWDFEKDPSDVVIINLGTNDNGATVNGQPVTDDYIKTEAVSFIKQVRAKNPAAVIVWAYGIMGSGRVNSIKAAIEELNAAGDKNIYFFALDGIKGGEGIGTHGHPTITTNITRSFALTAFISEKMGWEYNLLPQLAAQLNLVKDYNDDYLAGFTNETAQPMKEAINKAKALGNTATADEIKAAVMAIQIAKASLIPADADYSYARMDFSTGEPVGFNATFTGKSDNVVMEKMSDGKYAYKMAYQNGGYGIKIDPKVIKAEDNNVTVLVEYYMPGDVTQDNTRLGAIYTHKDAATGEYKGFNSPASSLRKVAGGNFAGAVADEWAIWELKLEDAAFAKMENSNGYIDWGSDLVLVKWGYIDDGSNGVDYVYVRSITVYITGTNPEIK